MNDLKLQKAVWTRGGLAVKGIVKHKYGPLPPLPPMRNSQIAIKRVIGEYYKGCIRDGLTHGEASEKMLAPETQKAMLEKVERRLV